MTFSLSKEIAQYLQSTPNASSTVAEAVSAHRARELEQRLENAYQEGAKEAERLNHDWKAEDSEVAS